MFFKFKTKTVCLWLVLLNDSNLGPALETEASKDVHDKTAMSRVHYLTTRFDIAHHGYYDHGKGRRTRGTETFLLGWNELQSKMVEGKEIRKVDTLSPLGRYGTRMLGNIWVKRIIGSCGKQTGLITFWCYGVVLCFWQGCIATKMLERQSAAQSHRVSMCCL